MLFSGILAIVVGSGMAGFWSLALANKKVPEIKTEPVRIAAHITGELVTAIALIFSGIALLLDTEWAKSAYLVACGMLIYTVIVSPGYYAQQGKWLIVLFFALILILAAVGLALVF